MSNKTDETDILALDLEALIHGLKIPAKSRTELVPRLVSYIVRREHLVWNAAVQSSKPKSRTGASTK